MLEELNIIAKELDQFRKSTNTKMSYPKVIKDKVVSILEKGFPISKVSEKTGIHCTTLGKWKSGQKKESPFITPEIVSDNKTTGGITLITGLSSDDLLKLGRESLPRSGLGKAINYTLNLWRGLTEFISDAKIPLTNNLAERVLRNPVKGRDNYLGYRTINGADVAMFYYSIIEPCKHLRINPRAYLVEQSERHWEKKELQTPIEWAKSQA